VTGETRQRIWFALFVLTVFCTGLASGVFLGRRMTSGAEPSASRAVTERPGMLPPFGRAGGPFFMAERLSQVLELTPTQRDRLDEVLKASRARAAITQREVRARFEDEQRTLHSQIRQILTPDQQVRFDRWVEQVGREFGRGRGERRPNN
jgi:Spy/CpxP family protein refolding chaperone